MITSKHEVNLSAESVRWFRENYGRDASLSWLLDNLLNAYIAEHIDRDTQLKDMLTQAVKRASEEMPIPRRRAGDLHDSD